MRSALALLVLGTTAFAGSEKPPKGAPWTMDFGEALAEASAAGKPVFLYFTKTY
jgi:hypothetical protein